MSDIMMQVHKESASMTEYDKNRQTYSERHVFMDSAVLFLLFCVPQLYLWASPFLVRFLRM